MFECLLSLGLEQPEGKAFGQYTWIQFEPCRVYARVSVSLLRFALITYEQMDAKCKRSDKGKRGRRGGIETRAQRIKEGKA